MSEPDEHGWLPIETAPRDGTDILGWFPGARCPQAMGFDRRWKAWHSIPGKYACGPTHWQPLPKPPAKP